MHGCVRYENDLRGEVKIQAEIREG
jgi:hypothetical protein